MTVQKFIHNREHVPMGCGPMTSCAVCKSTFGDVINVTDSSGVTQAIPTMDEMIKYVILGSIGAVVTTIVAEKFVKPILLKETR